MGKYLYYSVCGGLILFYHVGSEDHTWIIRLGIEYLQRLSHLVCPVLVVYNLFFLHLALSRMPHLILVIFTFFFHKKLAFKLLFVLINLLSWQFKVSETQSEP